MRNLSWVGVLGVLGVLSPVIQAAGPEFSAEVVAINLKDQSQQTISKIYVSNNRKRQEMAVPDQRVPPEYGKQVVQIINPERQAMWQIFPDAHKYWEWTGKIPSDPPALPGDSRHICAQGKGIVCNKLVTEILNGRSVDKWEVKISHEGKDIRNFVWIDPKLGMPIREETPGMGAMELHNIKEGTQPNSLFEPPTGFEKAEPPHARAPAGQMPPAGPPQQNAVPAPVSPTTAAGKESVPSTPASPKQTVPSMPTAPAGTATPAGTTAPK